MQAKKVSYGLLLAYGKIGGVRYNKQKTKILYFRYIINSLTYSAPHTDSHVCCSSFIALPRPICSATEIFTPSTDRPETYAAKLVTLLQPTLS